ncbi:lipocalin family protein [Rufibacter glacialis]|uniref:Lipocalin family protein n=1 Tax=Rufibacter glacialis TaxID=1259555 RepID=A0A5M8Q5Q7_9BACT|nr:lipocalin family protein [Rufibacter glacialis]KAA6430246.1 lipocalin family protein [Rufibacter glacialis]GGK87686.1 membrane protein [Rufibacter glacialis]
MRKSLVFAGIGLGLLALGGLYLGFRPKPAPLPTVPTVDLYRYAGKWYEIAAFPNRFQKGCHCTTAVYTPKEGYVEVRNSCRKGSANGKLDGVIGKAFPVEGSHNAKLRVQFFWPFRGDYWILSLAPDYSHVLVGAPDRQYLWILARTPQLDEAAFRHLVQEAERLGFDSSRLVKSDQSCQDK